MIESGGGPSTQVTKKSSTSSTGGPSAQIIKTSGGGAAEITVNLHYLLYIVFLHSTIMCVHWILRLVQTIIVNYR